MKRSREIQIACSRAMPLATESSSSFELTVCKYRERRLDVGVQKAFGFRIGAAVWGKKKTRGNDVAARTPLSD